MTPSRATGVAVAAVLLCACAIGAADPAVTQAPNEPQQFDFWILAVFWPPSVLSKSQHSWAQHALARHEAAPGMWTHGLWPVRRAGAGASGQEPAG